MTDNVDVDLVRTKTQEIVVEAVWMNAQLEDLEANGLDDGQGPAIRELCETLATTAMFDIQNEIDSLSDRLQGIVAADPAAPARLILNWLRADIEPIAVLSKVRIDNSEPSSLGLLLIVGGGEIINRFLEIEKELQPLISGSPEKPRRTPPISSEWQRAVERRAARARKQDSSPKAAITPTGVSALPGWLTAES